MARHMRGSDASESPEESLTRLQRDAEDPAAPQLGRRFRRVHLVPGYDIDEVDQFFAGIGVRSQQEIEDAKFPVRVRTGYDMAAVDQALDEMIDRIRSTSRQLTTTPSPIVAGPGASVAPGEPILFGRGTAGFRWLAASGLVVPIVLGVLTSLHAPERQVVPNMTGFGLMATFFVLTLSLSIEGKEALLILTGLLNVWTIPARVIRRVTHESGLVIWTTTGVSVDHVGYGGSVIGSITGNKQAAQV